MTFSTVQTNPLTICNYPSTNPIVYTDISVLQPITDKIAAAFSATIADETLFTEVLQKCNDKEFTDNHPSYFQCKEDAPGCLITPCGVSLLQESIRQGMSDCASLLVNKQWGLDYKDPEDNGPLHYAAATGNLQVFTDILQNDNALKVHLDEKNDAGHTPLYLASRQGHTAIVTALLERNANANERGPYQIGHTKLARISPLQLSVIH
ncbi:MAG: ankyrin repeat domain-containing protein, partial [Nitrosotalea sp.]